MKLDMIRMPRTGLPSAGTRVTPTNSEGRGLSDTETIAAGETEVVVLYPDEATALLTSSDGRRFERPVRAIVTGPAEEHDDPKESEPGPRGSSRTRVQGVEEAG